MVATPATQPTFSWHLGISCAEHILPTMRIYIKFKYGCIDTTFLRYLKWLSAKILPEWLGSFRRLRQARAGSLFLRHRCLSLTSATFRTAVKVTHEAPSSSSTLWISGTSLRGWCPMAWKNRPYSNRYIQSLLINSRLWLAPVPYGSSWVPLDACDQWSGRSSADAAYGCRYPAAMSERTAHILPVKSSRPYHVAF